MTLRAKTTVAIIGTGLIGPRHAKSVVACDDAELLCLVDPAAQAEAVANSLQVPLFNSIEEMLLARTKPDGAIVCTPNSTHAPVAKQLLAAGIHVLVEKPIATTISDGCDLVENAQLKQKQLLVGHHRRFNPHITAAKRALSDGIIGVPLAMSGLWVLCKPSSYFLAPADWRAKLDGGGVILINMIHEVDILQYLFGPITRVHAEQTASQREHEAEEGAAILLRFASGLVGTFVICDAAPSAHNFESGTGENPTIPHTGQDFYRIFGTKGTLSVGDMKVTRHAADEERSWTNKVYEEVLPSGNDVPFDDQVRHFVRVINGKEQPRCSGEDGLRALIVCDAIKKALTSGRPINIDK